MLLGFTLSNSLIIPLAAFVAFGAVTWLLLSHFFMARDDRAEQRLVELSDPRGKRGDDREAKKSEAISRVLQRASPTLAKPLTPTNEKDMGKLRQDLIISLLRSLADKLVQSRDFRIELRLLIDPYGIECSQ